MRVKEKEASRHVDPTLVPDLSAFRYFALSRLLEPLIIHPFVS
jgi:hypothetical protein